MIDHRDILASFRNELASHLARFTPPPVEPLPVSVWVAASALQKAIRRGHADIAIAAAATLAVNDPDRVWRRLGGIAFEDIGLADHCIVGLVSAVLAGKRVRAELGGEWRVASWLVQRLCASPKCRMTDDLLMATETLPSLANQRRSLADLTHDQLRRVILGTGSVHERALALIYLAGTETRPNPHFRPRRGEPALAFDVLDELGVAPTIIEISREGHRRTREALCLLLPLLAGERDHDTPTFADDPLPQESMAGPVPGWALDAYTREGKGALRRFLGTQAGLATWTRHHLPPGQRLPFLARVVFHAEGGLLVNRRRTALSDELRRVNEEEASGVSPEAMREAMALMRDDLPILNAIRAEIMEGQSDA
ncbi:MAG: hypothetical protein IOC54_10665 [Methylobacterium sp.]|nr:hypothetical protein [Methylobacterium sp.]MCA3652289.1 hypothetical protein [Methylobacterium sp.]MCA4921947.1 hypothetical protein [Methylobacterium sp.]